MTIHLTTTHYLPPIEVRLPDLFVVAVLSDASGHPIYPANWANATYIKTTMFDDRDEALNFWDDMREDGEPVFASVQDHTGESLI